MLSILAAAHLVIRALLYTALFMPYLATPTLRISPPLWPTTSPNYDKKKTAQKCDVHSIITSKQIEQESPGCSQINGIEKSFPDHV